MGWFSGFLLHRIVHDAGELLALRLTPGHVDDRQLVPTLVQGLCGQRFGDISQALHETLFAQGLALLTKIRKHMKPQGMRLWDTLLLRQHSLIETINDQGKNISQIAHTQHRSVTGGHGEPRCGLAGV